MTESLERLGKLLVDRGVISESRLASAMEGAPVSESLFLSRLLQDGAAAEGDLVAVLAERHGQPGVDLATSTFLLDVLDLIPRPVAEGDQVLALSTQGGRLHVAVCSPEDAQASIDEVRFITGMDVSLYVALAGPLERTITAAYDARERGESIWTGSSMPPGAPLGLTIVQPIGSLATPPSGVPTAQLAGSEIAPGPLDAPDPGAVPLAAEEVTTVASPPIGLGDDDEGVVEGELLEGELLDGDEAAGASVVGEVLVDPAATTGSGGLADAQAGLAATIAAEVVLGAPAQEARAPTEDIDIEVGDDGEDEEELEIVGRIRVGPKRILVVDDEPDIVKLCTRAFTVKGWLVETAYDGAEAEKKLAAKETPDLVLLDAMLPLVHGFEICQRIKANKHLRGTQVIMMSAVYRGWRFAQDAKETYGADDYIEKPFHLADLLRRVEEKLQAGEDKKKTMPGKREAERLYKTGMEALDKGRLPEARGLLEGAVREDPFSPRGHFALARTLSAQGDVYRAISSYERAVELRPNLFPALKNLASLYLEKGFRRKAAETLERALQAAPDPATRETIRAQLLRLL